jgi:hypothetical protein
LRDDLTGFVAVSSMKYKPTKLIGLWSWDFVIIASPFTAKGAAGARDDNAEHEGHSNGLT